MLIIEVNNASRGRYIVKRRRVQIVPRISGLSVQSISSGSRIGQISDFLDIKTKTIGRGLNVVKCS
jgi:hypothetical protein